VQLTVTLLLAVFKLTVINHMQIFPGGLVLRYLRELTLPVHHTFHHITMIVRTVVKQNCAVSIRPMITEITLFKINFEGLICLQ
jgi:hypothetical protein